MAAMPGIIIISAPSGAGKTTLTEAVLREFPQIERCVTTTTRARREDEVAGRDYRFVTRQEFEAMVKKKEFFESAEVHGNLYGTHRDRVQEIFDRGHHCLLVIDVQGAKQIREAHAHTKSIFIVPPSLEVLKERLEKRGDETAEAVERRLQNAKKEMREKKSYDFVLVNEDFDQAKTELLAILREIVEPRERRRSNR